MSPDRPDQDDFLEDEEQEEYGQRSIFATGWFRAVLVLLILAVIAVIAVPLIGGWFEPTSPPKVTTTKPGELSPPLVPVPSAPTPAPPAPEPSAAAPPASSPATPPPAAAPQPAPQPAPPATAPSKAPEKAKAPERTAAAPASQSKSAAKSAPAGGGNYWVQVGAFKESRNAEGLARTLRSEGFPVQVMRVTRDEPLHVVRVGGYPDRSKAAAARGELQDKGHPGFVTSGSAK